MTDFYSYDRAITLYKDTGIIKLATNPGRYEVTLKGYVWRDIYRQATRPPLPTLVIQDMGNVYANIVLPVTTEWQHVDYILAGNIDLSSPIPYSILNVTGVDNSPPASSVNPANINDQTLVTRAPYLFQNETFQYDPPAPAVNIQQAVTLLFHLERIQ